HSPSRGSSSFPAAIRTTSVSAVPAALGPVGSGRWIKRTLRDADVSWSMPSSKEPTLLLFRVVALGAVVALILGGFIAGAILLPSVCPGGSREVGTVCLSNATHLAPSSGIRIPVYSGPRDARPSLRVGIALMGLVL